MYKLATQGDQFLPLRSSNSDGPLLPGRGWLRSLQLEPCATVSELFSATCDGLFRVVGPLRTFSSTKPQFRLINSDNDNQLRVAFPGRNGEVFADGMSESILPRDEEVVAYAPRWSAETTLVWTSESRQRPIRPPFTL